MASLEGVKVGDTVLYFRKYGGRREEEQVPQEVTIVKVGRTLVHINKYEGKPEYGTETYRIDSGYRNDDYRHTYLMTREAYEAERRREEVSARLKKHGFEYNWRSEKKPVAVLEAVLKVLDDAEREG